MFGNWTILAYLELKLLNIFLNAFLNILAVHFSVVPLLRTSCSNTSFGVFDDIMVTNMSWLMSCFSDSKFLK